LNFAIAVVASYETSHYIIRPLRVLNMKMRDIISNGIEKDLTEQ
jgi:hypothetical protein